MDENLRIVLGSVIEVFGLVGIAYAYSRRFRPDFHETLRLVTLVLVPCLVFTAILGSNVDAGDVRDGVLATLIQIACGFGVGLVLFRICGWKDRRELLLPVAFANSANLPFPLLLANFGPDGLSRGVICFMVTSTLVFSVGLFILHGRARFGEALKEPVLWATGLAFLFKLFHIEPPEMAMRVPELAGKAAIPMMLILLGDSLARTGVGSAKEALAIVFARYGSGLLALWITLTFIQPEGLMRKVLIIYALLPAAVINVVLVRRVGRPAEAVAFSVLLSTIVSLILLPFLLSWLR